MEEVFSSNNSKIGKTIHYDLTLFKKGGFKTFLRDFYLIFLTYNVNVRIADFLFYSLCKFLVILSLLHKINSLQNTSTITHIHLEEEETIALTSSLTRTSYYHHHYHQQSTHSLQPRSSRHFSSPPSVFQHHSTLVAPSPMHENGRKNTALRMHAVITLQSTRCLSAYDKNT